MNGLMETLRSRAGKATVPTSVPPRWGQWYCIRFTGDRYRYDRIYHSLASAHRAAGQFRSHGYELRIDLY